MQENSSAAASYKAFAERVDASRLAWGLVLVVLGGLFALDRFSPFDIGGYYRFFPLILTVIAIACLATAKRPDQIRSGLWLLGISSWLLINLLHLGGFYWGNSWPLMVMVAGVVSLIQPEPGDSRWDGLWPLGIGLWLLVNMRGLGGLDWGNSWPLFLIVAGIAIVIRSFTDRKPAKAAPEGGNHEG